MSEASREGDAMLGQVIDYAYQEVYPKLWAPVQWTLVSVAAAVAFVCGVGLYSSGDSTGMRVVLAIVGIVLGWMLGSLVVAVLCLAIVALHRMWAHWRVTLLAGAFVLAVIYAAR